MISYTCFLEHEATIKTLSEIKLPLLIHVYVMGRQGFLKISNYLSPSKFTFLFFCLQNIEVLTNNLIFSWQTLGRPLGNSMHSSTVADFDEFCQKIRSPFTSKLISKILFNLVKISLYYILYPGKVLYLHIN